MVPQVRFATINCYGLVPIVRSESPGNLRERVRAAVTVSVPVCCQKVCAFVAGGSMSAVTCHAIFKSLSAGWNFGVR